MHLIRKLANPAARCFVRSWRHATRLPPRISIVCRYIFMHALSIRRVNPTDFDGRPKRQEEPEIAQVGRLSVMTKRTCPFGRGLAQRAHISDKDPRVA
jgi:hypothetical protein